MDTQHPHAGSYHRSERGAVSTEYALVTTLIALAIIAGAFLFGQRTADLFQRSCDSVASAQSSTC